MLRRWRAESVLLGAKVFAAGCKEFRKLLKIG